jgi:isopenicillin-N N-acyltransferase-like protein
MPAASLPFVKVHGSPYRRGRQHGRDCGDLIRRYPDVLLEVSRIEAQWRALDASRPAPRREDFLARAMRFLPALEAFAPHLVEEVRGIADGARLSFAEVLLVNIRAEVMGLTTADAFCTAFAVGRSATADGSVLSGQNLDQHPLNRDLMIVLKVEPDEGPAILMCSFAGLVGYPGISAAGVSLFQNALSTHAWRGGAMPHYFLKRVLLEQADLSGCLAVAGKARVCSSANYVLTDRTGALRDIEMTPDGMATLDADGDVIVHTNHFRSPALVAEEALLPKIPDSARRAPRMEAMLAERRGRIAFDDLKQALADHQDWPTAICRHEADVETIASIVAEPDQGRLHIAAGPPCSAEFVTYSL